MRNQRSIFLLPQIPQIPQIFADKFLKISMYAFGSILTDNFSSESDVDLIVDFQDQNVLNYGDNYYNLKFSLEDILNRSVDLLEEKAIQNPFI